MAVGTLNRSWLRSSAIVTVLVFVVAETMIFGASCIFGFPTRISFAFQMKSNGAFYK
jgi:hypothetical protein